MPQKYEDAFSLRDEIGTCPSREIDIDVVDKSSFFVRPYHVKKEDINVLDMGMKSLVHLGIFQEGFLTYSSQVMLVSRKLTQDKRYFFLLRHINVRIAKANLASPLVRDKHSLLGRSKWEVLSGPDLKDAFHWDFLGNLRNTLVLSHT